MLLTKLRTKPDKRK